MVQAKSSLFGNTPPATYPAHEPTFREIVSTFEAQQAEDAVAGMDEIRVREEIRDAAVKIPVKPVRPLYESDEVSKGDYATASLPPVGVNKKNLAAVGKAHMRCVPPVAIFALGAAMQNGGDKYGPFNYRDADVTASIFYEAMLRHIVDWFSGEDFADDSQVHHLAHLMAGAAIVLDALQQGNLVDDRPRNVHADVPAASKDFRVWKQMPGSYKRAA
jgi:hypothetical protein